MAELIIKTYGSALFELAKEEDQLSVLEEEANTIVEVLQNNVDFLQILNHPKISKDEKIHLLENALKNKITDRLLGLMIVVVKKDRYSYLVDILKYVLERIKEEKNIITAYITSAKSLDEEQKDKIYKKLKALTNKNVEACYTIDESLIGGLIIRIGDRIVDNSIKGKIQTMAKELMKVQLA